MPGLLSVGQSNLNRDFYIQKEAERNTNLFYGILYIRYGCGVVL